jgi:hypothetical protein
VYTRLYLCALYIQLCSVYPDMYTLWYMYTRVHLGTAGARGGIITRVRPR